MHVAVLASTERGADRVLAEAVEMVRGSPGRISVLAVRNPLATTCVFGLTAVAVGPQYLGDHDRVAVAALARRLVDRLPPDVAATHAAFLGWSSPELRQFLRSRTADRVLVVGAPWNPLARWTLMRASKSIAG